MFGNLFTNEEYNSSKRNMVLQKVNEICTGHMINDEVFRENGNKRTRTFNIKMRFLECTIRNEGLENLTMSCHSEGKGKRGSGRII